tara:strand:- start:46 stop:528 length:483 start_codon:yes stop_codon:yes gene_type:complete
MKTPSRITKTHKAIVFLLLLGPFSVIADLAKTGYKNEDPRKLAYLVAVHADCNFTHKSVDSMVEAGITRRGIEPLTRPAWIMKPLFLQVNVNCISLPSQENQIYTVESRMGDASGINIVFLTSAFFYGAGRESDIFETVEEAIERQLDEYLQANPDLVTD